MWNPTHVQFTVLRAKNLVSKGKGGNNDVFATIQLGKEKYQTTTIKKARNPEWFEECDLLITSMDAEIKVNLFHRGKIADESLGYAIIPLRECKNFDRPQNRWIPLQTKSKKTGVIKEQGELEVRLTFHVESKVEELHPLQKKSYTGSLRHLATSVAGKLKRSQSLIYRKDKTKPTLTMSNTPKSSDSNTSSQALKTAFYLTTFLMNEREKEAQINSTNTNEESKLYHCQDEKLKTMTLNEKFLKSSYATIDEVQTENQKVLHKSLENLTLSCKDHYNGKSYTLPKPDKSVTPANTLDTYLQSVPEHKENRRPSMPQSSGPAPSCLKSRPSSCIIGGNSNSSVHPLETSVSNTTTSHGTHKDPSSQLKLRPSSCIVTSVTNTNGSHPLDTYAANDPSKESTAQHKTKRKQRRLRKHSPYSYDQDADSESEAEENGTGHRKSNDEAGGKPNGIHSDDFNFKIPLQYSRFPANLSQRSGSCNGLAGSNTNPKDLADEKVTNGIQGRKSRAELDFGLKRPQNRNIVGLRRRPISFSFDGRLPDFSDSMFEYNSDNFPTEDLIGRYRSMHKEEMVNLIVNQKAQLIRKDQYIRGLETYIDDLLVSVIEQNPKMLQRQFHY